MKTAQGLDRVHKALVGLRNHIPNPILRTKLNQAISWTAQMSRNLENIVAAREEMRRMSDEELVLSRARIMRLLDRLGDF